MDKLDLTRAEWSKSSHSSANGQCIEVAQNLPGIVAIRDSKDPDGPKLLVSSSDWKIFLGRMRATPSGL